MAELKGARFILPAPDTLERASLAGRVRVRKAAAAVIVRCLGHTELARIDEMVINNADLSITPLA